jgi:hypothetical protein
MEVVATLSEDAHWCASVWLSAKNSCQVSEEEFSSGTLPPSSGGGSGSTGGPGSSGGMKEEVEGGL